MDKELAQLVERIFEVIDAPYVEKDAEKVVKLLKAFNSMDYRELLKKYMKLIRSEESSDFLYRAEVGTVEVRNFDTPLTFTQEELDELQRISQELE